jgi:hypothetical protein
MQLEITAEINEIRGIEVHVRKMCYNFNNYNICAFRQIILDC